MKIAKRGLVGLGGIAVVIIWFAINHQALPRASAGGSFSVQVLGTTNTQAVLAYTAPDANPCTIQVSENSSLSPLVHDVDPAIFPGANLDNRPGSLGAGTTSRVIVIGTRDAEKGTDGNMYSRALQAYTTHYYQITCDSETATGSFMTANIPTGVTYTDSMKVDPNNPGSYDYPTVSLSNRSEEIIDPSTGLYITHLSLPADDLANPSSAMVDGSVRFCSPVLATDSNGNTGYRCLIQNVLYFINKETGQATSLGEFVAQYKPVQDGWLADTPCGGGGASWDPSDPNSIYCFIQTIGPDLNVDRQAIVRATYVGNDQPESATTALPDCDLSPGSDPCIRWVNLTPSKDSGSGPHDLNSLMVAFVPSYAGFFPFWNTCDNQGISGGNIFISCPLGNQDDMAWSFVFSPGDKNPAHAGQPGGPNIIAGMNSWSTAPARWCGDHDNFPYDATQGWFQTSVHSLISPNIGTTIHNGISGQGPYLVTVTSGAVASGGGTCPAQPAGNTVSNWPTGNLCSTLTVSGEPLNPNNFLGDATHPVEPQFLQDAEPGDFFAFSASNYSPIFDEYVRLLTKTTNGDGTENWVVQRGYGFNDLTTAHTSSSTLTAICGAAELSQAYTYGEFYWNPIADPQGLNTLGTTIVLDPTGTANHQVYDQDYAIDAGDTSYLIKQGSLPSLFGEPQYGINYNPTFHGVTGWSFPNDLDSHPSLVTPNLDGISTFEDGRTFDGADGSANPATNVGGTIWKYPVGALTLNRMALPTDAFCGVHPLKDVSGPSSNISQQSYTYCVANNAGECKAGSNPGEVYVNCPTVTTPYCVYPGIDQPATSVNDICIGDQGPYVMQLTQTGLGTPETTGAATRVLTNGFEEEHHNDPFWNPRPLTTDTTAGLSSNGSTWMFFTVPDDPVYGNASNQVFLMKVPPYPGLDTVGRNDFLNVPIAVPAMSGAVSARLEFGYAENGSSSAFYCTSRAEACTKGSESGTNYNFVSAATAIACSNGCTINVPVIPTRVAYVEAQYLNGSGAVIGNNGVQVAVGETPFAVSKILPVGGGGSTSTPTSTPPDTTPPTVAITSPPTNSTVAGLVVVSATASDNIGVTKVAFYVDNVLQTSDATSPYTFSWNTSSVSNGSHVLTTKAYDAAGNVGSSPNIAVIVSNISQTPSAPVAPPATGGGSNGGGGGNESASSPTPVPAFSLSVSVATSTQSTAQVMVQTSLPAITQLFYGPTTLYGSTSIQSLLQATSYFNLTELVHGKTYYLKAVALANGVTQSSPDISFVVGAANSSVSSVSIGASGTGTIAGIGGAVPLFARSLGIGSTGFDVTELQTLLVSQGYLKVAPTGYYGSLTFAAVERFQSENNISPVGVVGPVTRAKLNSLIGDATTVAPTVVATPATSGFQSLSLWDQGSAVATLQNELLGDGYLFSGTYTPGLFDSATQRAVENLQCIADIVCSGGPGYGTFGPRTAAYVAEQQ